MTALNDLSALIHRSHLSFNAARENLASTLDADRPSIRSRKKIRRDLSAHKLSGILFYDCHFENVRFGTLSEISFNSCTFQDCDFRPSPKDSTGQREETRDVTFFECRFDGGTFERQNLHNVKIVDPVFDRIPSFKDAILSGRFVYDQGDLDPSAVEAFLEADTAPRCDVQVIGKARYPRLHWEHVRFASKLPFLQVSFVGIVAIAVFAVILGNVAKPVDSLGAQCEQILLDFPQVHVALEPICRTIVSLSFTDTLLSSLRQMFINFMVIFLGAFIQTTNCPSEIAEFSRVQWVRQLRRPSIFYTAISNKSRNWMLLSSALQATGVAFFLYRSLDAFFRTFT